MREVASPALIDVMEESRTAWTQLFLKHESGEEIALIERNSTEEGLGAEELSEFVEEVGNYKPSNAVQWLKTYLP